MSNVFYPRNFCREYVVIHDEQSETNTFSVTDEMKNKKLNIQQESISKKNHSQDGKSGVNSKSLISNDNTSERTCIMVHNCH